MDQIKHRDHNQGKNMVNSIPIVDNIMAIGNFIYEEATKKRSSLPGETLSESMLKQLHQQKRVIRIAGHISQLAPLVVSILLDYQKQTSLSSSNKTTTTSFSLLSPSIFLALAAYKLGGNLAKYSIPKSFKNFPTIDLFNVDLKKHQASPNPKTLDELKTFKTVCLSIKSYAIFNTILSASLSFMLYSDWPTNSIVKYMSGPKS
jgi:hypothetical protein